MPLHRPNNWWLSAFAALGSVSAQSNNTNNTTTASIVNIPYSWTYLLPDGFEGNINGSFINNTSTGNSTIDSTLRAATLAPFIAYDEEFYEVFGENPRTRLVDQRSEEELFAYEVGVWVPERDEVWFGSSVFKASKGSHISVFNLNTSTISTLNTTGSTKLQYVNGGYYHQGQVYFATYPSNTTYRGGIYCIDVQTLSVEPLVNSYFGLPFLSTDDIVLATKGNDKFIFFTDTPYSQLAWGATTTPLNQLPSGVWRFDLQTKVLQQVLGRNGINPNGIRVSPDQKSLYVTEGDPTYITSRPEFSTGGGAASWLGPYIYKYDLDEDMLPVNRRVFGLVREYIADGLHVDDEGRVWSAEGEGIVVRRGKDGKVLGLVNAQYFLEDQRADALPIANFALAGDVLVVGAGNRLWTVQLAKEVVSRGSSIVN